MTDELRIVASSWWESSTRFVFELLTADEKLSGNETTYISMVASWLQLEYPQAKILVEGVENHPILRISEIAPELVKFLRDNGYGRSHLAD